MDSPRSDIENTLTIINSAKHYDALWEALISFLSRAGADLVSYRHLAPPHAPDAGRVDALIYGYPRAWEKHYKEMKLHAHDPLMSHGYLKAMPFRWSEIFESQSLTVKQKDFIQQMKEWMKGDGYIIPVFGPSGRSGVFGVANSASITDWSPELIQDMQWVCRQFHLRYVALRLGEIPAKFTLDDVEHQILKDIALGRSLIAIALEMDVKTSVVSSTLDKLMLKMSVSDLPSLILRAHGLGLIKTAS